MRKARTLLQYWLKKQRKISGLSQKEVARILGLKSTSIISRWEQGVSRPSNENLLALAVIYGVLMDQLYIDLRKEFVTNLLPLKEAIIKERPP